MKIVLADHFGMCFGVRDAIAQAEELAEQAPLTILGELVHNPIVRERLRAQGMGEGSLDRPGPTSGQVMITAHGASDAKRAAWREHGSHVVDGTCPLVRHAHEQLKRLVAAGYFPVVIGKLGHVEVRGLTEDFPEARVVDLPSDILELPGRDRYGVISQTTQPIDRVRTLVAEIERLHPASEVRFVDTVCRPTKDRQSALRKLIDVAELIVVVGGRESNNTRQLVETCRAAGRPALHIERPDELLPEWFDAIGTVGLTAGTSTLPETVHAVHKRLRQISSAPKQTSPHRLPIMNSTEWLNYYRQNSRNRTEPQWHLPCGLALSTQRALARSLSHFQLGESGEGNFLLSRATREVPHDAAYHEALKLFIAEEQEHARLLEHLVYRFGGQKISRHWTHCVFRFVRRALGLNFELQVLVIAELVGTAYYRLLRARSHDPVLQQVCDRILRDETGHVYFHADWLGTSQLCFLPLEREPWRVRFKILFALAARIAWLDHRRCLGSIGVNRRAFLREAHYECIHFFVQLEHGNIPESTRRLLSSAPEAMPL